MWIKSKVYGQNSDLINTNSLDQIVILSENYYEIRGSLNDKFNILIYKANRPTQEDSEKKMAKIERCFKENRGFCDLDGEA
jgi:hypothetical protein